MVRGVVLLLLLSALLTGCIDDPGAKTGDDGAGEGPGSETGTEGPGDTATMTTEAPNLTVGTSWTYRLAGPWAFHETLTIVLSEATPDRYRFTGLTREDLSQDILEGFPLLGETDRSLNEIWGDKVYHQILSFPLHDGKTWEHEGITWTANATDLPTPDGESTGFRVTGTRGERTWTYGYAPTVGHIVTGAYEHATRGTMWTFALESVSEATTSTWYEYISWAWTGTGPNTTRYPVEESVDTVFLEAYGDDGTQGYLIRPDPTIRFFTGTGIDQPEVDAIDDPEPGEWVLAGAPGPDETFTLWAVGVAWQDAPLKT